MKLKKDYDSFKVQINGLRFINDKANLGFGHNTMNQRKLYQSNYRCTSTQTIEILKTN